MLCAIAGLQNSLKTIFGRCDGALQVDSVVLWHDVPLECNIMMCCNCSTRQTVKCNRKQSAEMVKQ